MIASRLSKEYDHDRSRDVKRGQERSCQADHKDRRVVLESEREDRVFAKKPAKWRATDQCQRADEKCNERDFQTPGQPTHVPDVLFVMKADNDRAGSEKEKRFEKRVSEQVKHRRLVRCQAHRHHHVAQLGDRGVGQDSFDIELLRGQ